MMNSVEFLMVFNSLANVIFARVATFDRQEGFAKCLLYARNNKLMPEKVLDTLAELWEVRNRAYSSPGPISIESSSVKKLKKLILSFQN